MRDILIGILAVLVGVVLAFRGYLAMRIVLPIWGAFIGFALGAGAVAAITDEGFLATTLGWAVGLVVAVVIAIIAYLVYAVAIVIAMASMGYALGVTVLVAFGVEWQWLIVLAGLVAGALLAWAAIALDLPAVLLVVLTALAGASTIIGGVMLLAGTIDLSELNRRDVTQQIDESPLWWVIYLGIALAGAIAQGRDLRRLGRSMRDAWSGEVGSA